MVDKKIMVVEDEAPIRNVYEKGLTRAGFTVCTASSAEEALVLIPKTSSMVFFLDLCIPGMDGVTLCKKIKQHWPMTIRIAVTGYASLYELNDCREAGFEDYFIKPVGIKDLVQVAHQAFAKIERWKSSGSKFSMAF